MSGTFIDRFKDLKSGMSQMQFAEKIGVSQKTVSRVENGETPSTDLLLSLQSVMGISIDWLLTGTGPKYIENYKDCSELVKDVNRLKEEVLQLQKYHDAIEQLTVHIGSSISQSQIKRLKTKFA